MKYLLLMTFAGTALFLGYCCWVWICGSFLTQSMKYKALVIILFVYLLPWMWLKRIYRNMISSFARGSVKVEIAVAAAKIVTEKKDAFWTQDYKKLLLISGIWFGVAVLLLAGKLIAYFQRRKNLLQMAKKCKSREAEKLLKELCEKVHLKRKPEIFQISSDHDSFTLGTIRPVIFLQEDYTPNELELILCHEMIHIIRNDLLIKILLEFICCLYWFNPVVHIFKRRLAAVCETSCDELIVRNHSLAEKGIYAKLIVKNMEEIQERPALESSFAGNRKKAKERVVLIMNEKQRKTWQKVIAAGVFAVMLFANSLTALAYPNVYQMEATSEREAEIAINSELMWMESDFQDEYNFDLNIIKYDRQFVDENGNIYPADETSPHILCLKHSIVSGYLQMHERNSSGGCTVYTYNSTRCTNCDTIWIGDLVSTTNYVTCPH